MWTYNDIASQLETLGIIKTICKFVRIYTLPLLKLDRKVTKTLPVSSRQGSADEEKGCLQWERRSECLRCCPLETRTRCHPTPVAETQAPTWHDERILLQSPTCFTRATRALHHKTACGHSPRGSGLQKFIYYVICTWAMQLSPTQVV